MEYRRLGGTGLRVSAQCLGAMMFGKLGNRDHGDCASMIAKALDAGINFVDTADVYSRGESEEIVGEALTRRRDDVIVATKVFNPMGRDRNQRGGSRRWILRAAEESLRRLGTDYIDLYQVHRHDWSADIEETLGALTDLVRQGKVRYLGASSFPASWIVEAQWAADRRHLERFVVEQPQYSVFARSAEAEVLPTCQRHRIGVICWSPLAGGWLTGKYRRETGIPDGTRYGTGGSFSRAGRPADDPVTLARFTLVERLEEVAKAAGLTLTQLAYAFAAEHPAITSAIIGPRTHGHLDDALAAADIRLDEATLDAIDKVIAPGTDAPGAEHHTGDPSLRPGHRRRAVSAD